MTEQKQITFTIDGQRITGPAGTLVIEAAKRMGIEVPSFCYYPGLSLQAACRMCLVEVEKAPKLQTACTLVATEGMVIHTNTPLVHKARKDMLEFVLTNHPLDCPVCDKGGECELQDMTFRYGLDHSRFQEEKLHYPEEKFSPLVYFDAPRCILCFRCVRVCDEGMDVKALGVGARGVQSVILPNNQGQLACEECGMCIDICPVGALTSGTYRYQTRPWEAAYVPSPCAHCSNGCKTTLSIRNNEIVRANNRDLSGINGEFLCAKGRFGYDFTDHPERIRRPLVRRDGSLQPATWEDALGEVTRRLVQVREKHGPNAIGFIGSNRTTNEENYLLNRLARACIGTNNLDHHRTADYASLAAALGPHAARSMATMADIEAADAILLAGNDATQQNPLVAWQIRSAVRQHNANLYILNSLPIKLYRKARELVEIPAGSEALIMRWLASGEGNFHPELSAQLARLKEAIQKAHNLVILFGAEVSGGAVGDVVRFGGQVSGQVRYMALGDYANSRGAADMGVLPDLLPGYSPLADGMRSSFSDLWGGTIPEQPGLDARSMMKAAVEGRLKALYVMGANPVKTFAVREPDKLGGLELMVVHELFLTETAQRADIILPAACGYEKEGTVTNTAGQLQKLRRALEPQGPRSDFDLLRIVMHQLAQQGAGTAMGARTAEAVFEEIRQHVRGYDVPTAGLLAGGAERVTASFAAAKAEYSVPNEAVFSSRDNLFSSGSLGRYFRKINSCNEAKDTPWISSPSIQSWWYR